MCSLDQSLVRWSHTWAGVAVIIAALALFGATPAAAQSDDATLRNEVGALHRTVDDLNAKIQDLERRLVGRPQPPAENVVVPPAADTTGPAAAAAHERDPEERWHDIERGMSKADVEAVIGRPSRAMDVSPRTVWYYQYARVGSGSVVFASDGSVIDWQTPPFGTWW
jgi:hypothetical protein